ncbi:hypothetical protein HMPREF1092_01281 [Clostridium thermobutyricum]|uniref:Uncharacterized protein n=1 Tax=Clostridium thermobutyricum TaxID=29372 RepID=N9WG34_9CLOT|nr:hypothetical protein [Clostridium thermobutyricum]ENZ02046.1 hypothetical protein HMPREF1092_01281 [Clostridium thermobutyricum]
MFDNLGILIYLDEVLVKSISSIQGQIVGYIDIRTRRKSWDIGVSERCKSGRTDTMYLEERNNKDKREGFKGTASSDAETKTMCNDHDKVQEQRGNARCEEEIKQIYTSYVYHQNFYNGLIKMGRLNNFCAGDKCNEGDYIFIKGRLIGNTILSYIESILLIIETYGSEIIDSYIPSSELLNTSKMKILLEKIKEKLSDGNIFDLLIEHDKGNCILQINSKCFCNENCFRNSSIGCNINIVGKVMRRVNSNEDINLLRKLNQEYFYKELLIKVDSIFSNIDLGITIPRLGDICICNSIQVMPISIYI